MRASAPSAVMQPPATYGSHATTPTGCPSSLASAVMIEPPYRWTSSSEPSSSTARRISLTRYGWRRSRGTADSSDSSRRDTGSAGAITGGSAYALGGR